MRTSKHEKQARAKIFGQKTLPGIMVMSKVHLMIYQKGSRNMQLGYKHYSQNLKLYFSKAIIADARLMDVF